LVVACPATAASLDLRPDAMVALLFVSWIMGSAATFHEPDFEINEGADHSKVQSAAGGDRLAGARCNSGCRAAGTFLRAKYSDVELAHT
jgi:hypothetical protein